LSLESTALQWMLVPQQALINKILFKCSKAQIVHICLFNATKLTKLNPNHAMIGTACSGESTPGSAVGLDGCPGQGCWVALASVGAAMEDKD
jgi:hypothetical protein